MTTSQMLRALGWKRNSHRFGKLREWIRELIDDGLIEPCSVRITTVGGDEMTTRGYRPTGKGLNLLDDIEIGEDGQGDSR